MDTRTNITTRFYRYNSFEPFTVKVKSLLSQIPQYVDSVISINIFSSMECGDYHEALQIIRDEAKEFFGCVPLLTYIIQPLFKQGEIAAEVYISRSQKANPIELPNGVRYKAIKLGVDSGREACNDTIYLVEGIVANSFSVSMREQSREVCLKISELLNELGLSPSSIIRQWNYIGNIIEVRDGEQNYQVFNEARSELYATDQWSRGYPAATGIGTSCNGLVVSLIIYSDVGSDICQSINNPQQISAHLYSQRCLVGGELANKTTPKFERAKTLIIGDKSICFISGTAAICGEYSLCSDDVVEQTLQTIENIEVLISDENMAAHNSRACSLEPFTFRVYVKYRKDFEAVRRVVEARWGSTAQLYLEADVCRDELLVEIEGVARGGVR